MAQRCDPLFIPSPCEVHMNSLVVGGIARPLDHESIDEWIVETLCRRGPLTLDYLNSLFPKLEEARLLFAVDRLSESEKSSSLRPTAGTTLFPRD